MNPTLLTLLTACRHLGALDYGLDYKGDYILPPSSYQILFDAVANVDGPQRLYSEYMSGFT